MIGSERAWNRISSLGRSCFLRHNKEAVKEKQEGTTVVPLWLPIHSICSPTGDTFLYTVVTHVQANEEGRQRFQWQTHQDSNTRTGFSLRSFRVFLSLVLSRPLTSYSVFHPLCSRFSCLSRSFILQGCLFAFCVAIICFSQLHPPLITRACFWEACQPDIHHPVHSSIFCEELIHTPFPLFELPKIYLASPPPPLSTYSSI